MGKGKSLGSLCFCVFFSSILSIATSLTLFNFTSFTPNTKNIDFSGDAFASGENVIHLTRNQADSDSLHSSGRVTYTNPIQLWDPSSRVISDFTTHFEFIIKGLDPKGFGDGLAFFMGPVGSELPQNSTGEWLGLFNSTTNNSSSTKILAVELDTFMNKWDPSANHIGIDINSIVSVANVTWKTDIRNGAKGSMWIGYNSTLKNLLVFLTYGQDSYVGVPSLSYQVDLMDILPKEVVIGFSASTGSSTELHKILSWDFVSTMGFAEERKDRKKKSRVIPIVVPLVVLIFGLGITFMFWRRKQSRNIEVITLDAAIEDQFAKGTGPRKFSYKELALATKSFSEDGLLGKGGFGGVYRGVVRGRDAHEIAAVKKISRGSSQGKKEYISEVTIISRLRHRNLVRLIGWCHEYGEFLLVYEYMSNGSLDTHLFGTRTPLKWELRYKISLGLASALLYLHEEWEQCVVHRDVKSSNVMLDSNFNTKLGDFGLARFVDHELGSQTTVLAGTLGYLAPECVTTGKASKESDVYSFGIVALEIACGRKPVEPKFEQHKVRLVDWVWGLYGCGRLLDAVDVRLNSEFNQKQMEHLLTVGLWCAHPDCKLRPSIRQAIKVLNFEAPLPSIPLQMPVPIYYTPLIQISNLSNYASSMDTQSLKDHVSCITSSTTTSSRASSATARLNVDKE